MLLLLIVTTQIMRWPSTSHVKVAALSYVWGDRRNSHHIVVNDVQCLVGENLESVLRALSRRPDFQGRYKLWVDAICINQKDFQERDTQVGKMRKTYGEAWSVVSWLGEERGNNDSEKAFGLIRTMSIASKNETGDELEAKLRKHPDFLGSGCWLALHELMAKRYWYRLWIIQVC
jgi:hypothetical protein